MKIVLYLLVFVSIVVTNTAFAKNNSGDEGMLNGLEQHAYNSCFDTLFQPDTCKNKLTLLSFNTDMQELAPAIRNGWLYYIESKESKQQYRIVLLEYGRTSSSLNSFDSGGSNRMEFSATNALENVYVNFSSDGKTVLLNTIDERSKTKKLFVGNSENMGDIKKLKAFPYNDKKYSIGRASISPDSKKLVFSTDMPGSAGGVDLWMCELENGIWSSPENLGNLINTRANEAMPFFISNTRLCFASEGHTGYGGFDLFYTDWQGNGFTPPVNMGMPVNTPANETGVCFSSQTGLYYFASDRKGSYDIYSYGPVADDSIDTQMLVEKESDHHRIEKTNAEPELPLISIAESTRGGEPEKEIRETDNQQSTVAPVPVPVPEKPVVIDSVRLASPVSISNTVLIEEEAGKKQDIAETPEMNKTAYFYAIQIMSIKPETYVKQYFREKLDRKNKYFVVREDGWVKIRTGHFTSYRDAFGYATSEGIDRFYIVRMNDGQISEDL